MEDRTSIEEAIAGIEWFHKIELRPGLITPGRSPSREKLAALDRIGLPTSLDGKRILDVGAWDGFFAFEMENRGAEVLAIDHVAPSETGFQFASSILRSKVQWEVCNIYQLSPDRHGQFDIVLCLGVIYHLRHIALGLDRLRALTKTGGDIFVDTAAIDRRCIVENRNLVSLVDGYPGINSAPLLEIHPRDELMNDFTNVFVPNLRGLKALLELSEFEYVCGELGEGPLESRALARGRAIEDRQIAHYRERDGAVAVPRVVLSSV